MQVSQEGSPPSFYFSLRLAWKMQTLHFIFLLLEDVRWEGDFGDSDSWSSVLPCGNWIEMSRGCVQVSWKLSYAWALPSQQAMGFSTPCWVLSVRRTLLISAACGLELRCFDEMDSGQGQLAWTMAFISNGEKKKSLPSVVCCFISAKCCFSEPTMITTLCRKEILTLCSLWTRNCITSQMTATCVCGEDVQHRAGGMGTPLRVSDRLGIWFSFLIRRFLMPAAR